MSSRPRGRPRSFDPAEALARASERFRTRGFGATSLDELAEATSLGRPSLYAAFGDKRALYLQALARAHEQFEAQLRALVAARLPLDDALAHLFAGAIYAYLSGERGPSGCLVIGTAVAEAVAEAPIRDALAKLLAMQDRLLEELLHAANSPTPAAHARLVAATLHSMSTRARAGEGRAALERLARDCIAVLAG